MTPDIVCFGETLWDIFPDKKVIGGAPLNVALRLHSLKAKVLMISRVGQDTDGDNLLEYLKNTGLNTASIQIDEELPTGNVQVHLDAKNTATYTISEPVAWDRIVASPLDEKRISASDAFIFGSLSCRNQISRQTLSKYMTYARFKVFDANLRPPFVHIPVIMELMRSADLIKLNDEELDVIMESQLFDSKSIEAQILHLSEITNTSNICITLGADGALFFTKGNFYRNQGYQVIVKDTVGAGDSFLASLVFQFVQGLDPQKALDYSCAMGSLVASKVGANATVTEREIEAIKSS
jgi:fructokinase